MAVISVCSTKGGVGKTTLVMCLADAFARQGGSVAIVDGDPNGHVASWRERAGEDCQVAVISEANETRIQDVIAEAAGQYALVFVDLEGAASQAVTYAIAESDMVLIPTKISGMDLQEVYRTYEVVKRAEKMLKRGIPARVVFSQMNPLNSRVATHARQEIRGNDIPVLSTEVIQRAAYQQIHFTGETPSGPAGDPKAAREIAAVLAELLEALAAQAQAA
ncbi:ParA family protein [Caulobacter rhizosphaerae]|uniref:ParA family protein n=1 Tax=Caulobacter rhizosphaerae TaxID=2010972 RepID=UPI0013D3489A|nr:ParA family protein [Caulobacter rhizosphaerae]GGL35862.1 cobyrinic acid a,c-diamide synthase [Caulobacter rhizosphaerae]